MTGYQVYWSGGSDSGNISVGAGSGSVHITGLIPDLTYNITIVALSDHLPSSAVAVMVYTLGETHNYTEIYHTVYVFLTTQTLHIVRMYCAVACILSTGYFHSVKMQ